MLFFLLAVCVIVVGRWQEAMFLGVVFANIVIGIVQELRSKATLDKLTLLTEPRGTVVRDGRERTIETRLMVRDDVVVFSAGSQIFADAVVVSGECSVNEALITGEADEIKKTPERSCFRAPSSSPASAARGSPRSARTAMQTASRSRPRPGRAPSRAR